MEVTSPEQTNVAYVLARVALVLVTAVSLVVAWLAGSATWGLVSAVALLAVALLDVAHAVTRPVDAGTPAGAVAFQRGLLLSLLSVGALVLLTNLVAFESTPPLCPGTVVSAVALLVGIALALRLHRRS